MEPYTSVKMLHVTAVALTATLFAVRLAWRTWTPARLDRRWVRVVPHVIDTVLLLSGLWLALQIGAAGVRGWLPAKIFGLVLYIVLGTVAIKRGRSAGARTAAGIAALAVLAWIVSVALSKSPWGFLAA
jgi:uncharacterized membrane protein SirB2